MMYLLKVAGYAVSGSISGADVVIVNTCAFIERAKTEAIETILELGSDKKEGGIKKIVVAGCLPERYRDEILDEMPEVDAILGVGSFESIVEAIETVSASSERAAFFGNINAPISEGRRIITSSRTWTYLKIAEGCDNRCAYCIIPQIRGRFRSRRIEEINNEAEELVAGGVRELILVAQDVTRYGLDNYGKYSLTGLLKSLCEIEKLKWIRLHYLYPAEIDDELVSIIAANEKIINYLDIPIQHISDGILKKMNRRGTGGEIRTLLRKLRDRIPGLVLRTSIVTGLPGEGEREFEELCQFLMDAKIERAGVFPYSPEEGTAAALMDRPDSDTAMRRAEAIEDIQAGIMDDFNRSRIGSVTTVLIEGHEADNYYGRSYAESPDVDGYIRIEHDSIDDSGFIDVRITGMENGELIGEPAARS